eukprot:scaffold115953_cov51-Attheya_sp.AAC.1
MAGSQILMPSGNRSTWSARFNFSCCSARNTSMSVMLRANICTRSLRRARNNCSDDGSSINGIRSILNVAAMRYKYACSITYNE